MDTNRLDELKARLDSRRPLPSSVAANLREDIDLRWTYNSNAIEGNTLTLRETKVVLEGITVGGKSIREHLEATNHIHAIDFLRTLVEKQEPLSERVIKDIHALVLKGIDDESAGRYRQVNVTISGAEHVPPVHLRVQEEMDALLQWYSKQSSSLHPVELAARVHVDFVKVHPFSDGNGRTARLLMNLELLKSGFPPVIVRNEQRLEYYAALDEAHVAGDYGTFFTLMQSLVERSFEPYWFALGLEEKTED